MKVDLEKGYVMVEKEEAFELGRALDSYEIGKKPTGFEKKMLKRLKVYSHELIHRTKGKKFDYGHDEENDSVGDADGDGAK